MSAQFEQTLKNFRVEPHYRCAQRKLKRVSPPIRMFVERWGISKGLHFIVPRVRTSITKAIAALDKE